MKVLRILLLIILLVCYASPARGSAGDLDARLFHFFNHRMRSSLLDEVMYGVTHLGSGEALALGALLLYLGGEEETVLLLTNAQLRTALYTGALKRLTGRARPVNRFPVRPVQDYMKHSLSNSFPSGHTATSFTSAKVLAGQYPAYAPHLYAGAALVGISRVYMGVHYPSDVLFGALMGYISGQSTMENKRVILDNRGVFLEYILRF